MRKVRPSERHRQALSELLEKGTAATAADHSSTDEATDNFVSQFVHRALQRMVTEALEQEVTDFLGREHYCRRSPQQPHRGYRNGYETVRLKTAEGGIPVEVPQLRQTSDPYRSALLKLIRQRTDALEHLVIEGYARGLSTRDLEALLADDEEQLLISKDGVSELTEALWTDYQTFIKRDLSHFDLQYLFVDAVFESMRQRYGLKEGILVAWGICADGQRVLLHMALGNKESYDNWLDFFRDMVARGLQTPVMITSDGAPGLIRAIETMWAESLRQRCLVHKKRNILAKVPDHAVAEVRAHLDNVWLAPTHQAGQKAAAQFVQRFEHDYPSAVRSFRDDLEASLNHLKCPVVHRKAIRTTNLIERAFAEQRRRTKVIPRFFNEKSCLKLVFATLIRTSNRWRRITMSDLEKAQLRQLRKELFSNQHSPSTNQAMPEAA